MSGSRLVADVGGTNTRIALFDEDAGTLSHVTGYQNSDHACLEDIISLWLDALPAPAPRRGCIAAAAPPAGDRVHMINIGWSFSCRELARRFGLQQLRWLNDFQANAHALPHLGADGVEQLCAGQPEPHAALATLGPGTGLGGATLRRVNGLPVAFASEPGHAGLSPASELEFEIFRRLLPRHGNIYAELLVSGAGLARLYRTIAEIENVAAESLDPAEVSRRALAGEDPRCVSALHTFCALLGSACGDFVLSNGAYGGLYVAGGIVPRMPGFLRSSEFINRLRAKGAMGRQLESVPVYIVTEPHPGLVGAAHVPLQAA